MSRLRWLTILVPVLLVGVMELVSDSLLDVAFPVPLDTVLIVGVVFAVSAVFSVFAFRRIDRLTEELRERNDALEGGNARAAALHRVSVAITALADLDAILRATVTQARGQLAADTAVLLLVGPDDALVPRAWSGPDGAVEEIGTGEDDPFAVVRADLAISRLASPLQRGSETIGVLIVTSATQRTFSVEDVETLSSLAIQAAIAIENDRLQRRLRELAVVAERERIAREMHDGLAQVLGYVNTKSQAASELLAAGCVAEAQGQLDELAAAARSVYVDVREAIVGLRSPIPSEHGLVEAIEEHARRFAEAAKIAVVVEASDAARAVDLSPEAEAQAFRIVQESFTNIRKHAAARRARVALDVEDGRLVVAVVDDGRGFAGGTEPRPSAESEPLPAPGSGSLPAPGAGPLPVAGDWPRYGLDSMRERAAAIGGSVAWRRATAGGTEVRLVVPVRTAAASPGVGIEPDARPAAPEAAAAAPS